MQDRHASWNMLTITIEHKAMLCTQHLPQVMHFQTMTLHSMPRERREGAHPEDLLHRVHALPEHVNAQLLKSGTCDAGVEVNTLKQAVDLNGGLC